MATVKLYPTSFSDYDSESKYNDGFGSDAEANILTINDTVAKTRNMSYRKYYTTTFYWSAASILASIPKGSKINSIKNYWRISGFNKNAHYIGSNTSGSFASTNYSYKYGNGSFVDQKVSIEIRSTSLANREVYSWTNIDQTKFFDGLELKTYVLCDAAFGGGLNIAYIWLEVDYTLPTYSINFYNDNTKFITQTKQHGTNLTLTSSVPTKKGYTFNGWNTQKNGSGTGYNSSAVYTNNANLTLYAQWLANTYTITFILADATKLKKNIVYGTLPDGEVLYPDIAFEDPIGYTADGYRQINNISNIWFDSQGHLLKTYDLDSDLEVYAASTPITYQISFANNEHETIDIKYNNLMSNIEIPAKEGYNFLGYYYQDVQMFNNLGEPTVLQYKYPENITLVSKWEPATAFVLFRSMDGSYIYQNQSIPYFSEIFYTGDEIPVRENPPRGKKYTFIGWTSDPNGGGTFYPYNQKIMVQPKNENFYAWFQLEKDLLTTPLSYVGNKPVYGVYVGNKPVVAIYKGNKKIY